MNHIEEFVALQVEANRIVQGIAKATGKPKDHIEGVWKETDKEVVLKHKYGVADRYREIGNIVRAKMGVAQEKDDDTKEPENKADD